ncbi:MAG: hypothetical protein M1820_001914 [Bogoriella megaspora]|nr:MAG: hypothetical protein M1820_001914 [Bogoriella megaspora]
MAADPNIQELLRKPKNELMWVTLFLKPAAMPEANLLSLVTRLYRNDVEMLTSRREYEIAKIEQYEFTSGPLSILQTAVRSHTQVLISIRNGRKILGRVKAFDRHCNMVIENAKEMWTEYPRVSGGGKGRAMNKDRFISKMHVKQFTARNTLLLTS